MIESMTANARVGDPDLGDVVFSAEQIARAVEDIAARIRRDYGGAPIVLIGVLQGAGPFCADLVRALRGYPLTTDYLTASSYGTGRADGESDVRIVRDITIDVEDKDVLLVDDIIDEGITLAHLLATLRSRRPRSLRACVLVDKPFRRSVAVAADYVGLSGPDAFLVGYGLDHQERYRNLPLICKLRSPG